jgi:hyperosmotically inducible periplasmic protein
MKKITICFFTFIAVHAMLSCSPSDEQVTESVQEALSANTSLSPVSASVEKGVVTLSGEVENEELKSQAESSVSGIKGVKSVVNSLTVKPKGPSPEEMTKAADDAILAKVKENFATYKVEGITATVADSIVTLTGNVKRANVQNAMKAAMESGAAKVENKMTIN